MQYVKTQPHLQRKGVAYYRSSTLQTVTAVGQTLDYAFQVVQYNNSPDKIVKISNSVVQLKGGGTYRVSFHVLGYYPDTQFSVAVALYNADTNDEITTGLESVSFSTTYANHEVPSAPGEYILSPTSDLKITCKVKYLTNQMNIGNTSFRIMIEELEVYTPQAVGALSCTSIRSKGTYDNTTSNGPNVFIDSAGLFYRSTSSVKYKRDIEDLLPEFSSKIYALRPVWYRSACKADREDHSWYGLIAEEVAAIEPRLCTYNDKGEPEGVDYARLSVLLLKELQRLRQEVDEIKENKRQS